MRGIGEVARASGLSVSALRFYDGAGVLVPAVVDPSTGYRRYTAEQIKAARLIAGLRRVGMPVAEIAAVVKDLPTPVAVRVRLDAHLIRLESGLADAKRELLRLHTLLDLEEKLMTRVTLSAADLSAALAAVIFAGASAADPIPAGVLFETGDGVITLVATDRYRMAVATSPAVVEGTAARLFLPLAFAERLRAFRSGPITIDLDPGLVTAQAGDTTVEDEPINMEFPDYQRLISAGPSARRITVGAEELRELIAAAPAIEREFPVSVLSLDPAAGLRAVGPDEWAADSERHIALNREFLLQALDAGGDGQLVLELDGPVLPLMIRPVGVESHFSLLMPVRH
ncbi:DNA polymerase III subunit beta family protein [Actinoplanes derwentensis]|uniref:DNA polymerase III beta subunit, central domain n=1 Tax=Actinoplanes derwentensis TaxID=113562 RepID=A0A1H2D3D6_9ACTN|nr:MerR family transcriptional regulator [Actinoplanes derwentensis]SDT76746.1 DNA polymerase III beta subunit, central domain [Actinoplanes derwentensis]